MSDLDLRYALWGATLLALALLPAFAGFAGIGWELAQAAGLGSALACLALFGSPVRPRDSVPPTLLSLRRHALIGWLALAGAAIHVGGLVLIDRTVVEYLKPTAPLYQLAGIAAALLLLVLVFSSLAGVRRRLWASHRGFQATHVILGALLAGLIAVHLVASARYVGGPGRRVLLIAGTIGAMLMLLRQRRATDPAHRPSAARRRLVFGRHTTRVVGVLAISAAAVAGLFPKALSDALREPLLHRAHTIPLDFPHGKHGMINCLICHHNYADGRGWGLCVQCHRSDRADLKEGVEARFHGFCFECHRHPQAMLKRHGPVAGCTACHQPPGTTK
ncbi:MAG: cytochrome c3 family protein [Steroidobacteraceae bacterium]